MDHIYYEYTKFKITQLPYGTQSRVAEKLGLSKVHVKRLLLDGNARAWKCANGVAEAIKRKLERARIK